MVELVGGLGGLGGVPAIPTAGGDTTGDILQALGMALLSGDRQNPLKNVGTLLQATQQRRTAEADKLWSRQFQVSEAQRAQKNADRAYDLQEKTLANSSTPEIAKNLQQMGLVPGTQAYQDTYKALVVGKQTELAKIGEDPYGNAIYGVWDKSKDTIRRIDPNAATLGVPTPLSQLGVGQSAPTPGAPAQSVAGGAQGPAIPPPPAGVDPKTWRSEQTKHLAQEGRPTMQQQNDLGKAEKTAADLFSALDNYNKLVAKHGAEAMPGPVKSAMATAYTDLILKMKEAANLGVLNGPDLELMKKQLEDATVNGLDFLNPLRPFGIEDRISAQVGQIRKSTAAGLENARRAYGGTKSVGTTSAGTGSGAFTWSPGKGLTAK